MSISSRPRAINSVATQDNSSGFDSLFALIAFALLLGVAALAPIELSGFWPVTRDYFPQSLNLIAACVACLMLALNKSEVRFSPISWLLVAFVGCNVASYSTSVYRHDSLLELARLAGALVWFFVARALICDSQLTQAQRNRRALWLLLALMVGALWVCGSAIINFVQVRGRQQATFYNTNLFANYAAMCLPLALSTLFASRKYLQVSSERAIFIFGALSIAIVGAGLLLSGSKGGLLAGAMGVLWSAILLWRARREHLQVLARAHKSKFIFGALFFALIAGGLFVQTVLPRLQQANTGDNHSTMFRVYAWRSTLEMANAKPILGHGPGTFPSAYSQFAQAGYTRSAHQSWLQIASESGWVSLLILLAASVFALKNAYKYLQTSRWPLAVGSSGALIALLVHGMTDSGWGIQSIAILCALCLAIMDAPQEPESLSQSTASTTETSRLSFGWLLWMLPLAWCASYGFQAQSAESLRFQSRQTYANRNATLALEQARQATQNAPLDARAWTNLGQLLESDRQTDASIAAYRRALELQPTRAASHLRLAQLFAQSGAHQSAATYFDRAVALDPNDIDLRLQRAQWSETLPRETQITRKSNAFSDYERVVKLADEPYGRYPAIPEIVNLGFNRARLKLIEAAITGKDFVQARQLIARGENDLQRARDFPSNFPYMARALSENPEGSQVPTPEEIEAQAQQFAEFKAKLP